MAVVVQVAVLAVVMEWLAAKVQMAPMGHPEPAVLAVLVGVCPTQLMMVAAVAAAVAVIMAAAAVAAAVINPVVAAAVAAQVMPEPAHRALHLLETTIPELEK